MATEAPNVGCLLFIDFRALGLCARYVRARQVSLLRYIFNSQSLLGMAVMVFGLCLWSSS